MSEDLHKSHGFALKQWDNLQAENKRLLDILEQIARVWYDGDEVIKIINTNKAYMMRPSLPPPESYPGSALPNGDKFSDV